MKNFRESFGTKEEVDPIAHLLGTAAGWGGNPAKDAIYLNVGDGYDGKLSGEFVTTDVISAPTKTSFAIVRIAVMTGTDQEIRTIIGALNSSNLQGGDWEPAGNLEDWRRGGEHPERERWMLS